MFSFVLSRNTTVKPVYHNKAFTRKPCFPLLTMNSTRTMQTDNTSSPLVTSLLKQDTQSELTQTDSGALSNPTSGRPCLDLFFLAGACRELSEDKIEEAIHLAYQESALTTLKLAFWAGDCRGGLGERRFFRITLNYLRKQHTEVLLKLIELVPHYNRWDSLFHLVSIDNVHSSMQKELDIHILSTIEKVLHDHPTPLLGEFLLSTKSLLAKYMPRKKQFNNFASKYRKYALLDAKQYRAEIVALSKTVEQNLCKKDYASIEYGHVPSKAMTKYGHTFLKRDPERYTQYATRVKEGKDKVTAGAIFPHDIYKALLKAQGSDDNNQSVVDVIDAQWGSQPNYLEGRGDIRILPIVDTSGSMEGTPKLISVALGIYVSERNESAFKNAFVIFSDRPKIQYLTGNVLSEKVKQFKEINAQNTDLQAVFEQILIAAKKDNLTQDDLPTHIMIISDMEFDQASPVKTSFELIDEQFKSAGYTRPNIIFWNVNGRSKNVPITAADEGTCLISGASPSIIKGVLSMNLDPIQVMLDTLNKGRYYLVEQALKCVPIIHVSVTSTVSGSNDEHI